MKRESDEVYVSVDVEAAGPVPGEFSMLSVGACLVDSPSTTFYAELKPTNDRFVAQALAVSGLSLGHLRTNGRSPEEAMRQFRDWVVEASAGKRPVFVGFNASFDWSFVSFYFEVYLGENPFGIGALDIKAYFMGLTGCSWAETTSDRLPLTFRTALPHTNNALEDAIAQAAMFAKMLDAEGRRSG